MRIVLFFVLYLAGCAAVQPDVVVKPQVIEVPKLVVERCFDASQIPPTPVSNMRRGMDHRQLTAAVLLDLEELEIYAAKLRALIESCAK